jgi:hypothetical protein
LNVPSAIGARALEAGASLHLGPAGIPSPYSSACLFQWVGVAALADCDAFANYTLNQP